MNQAFNLNGNSKREFLQLLKGVQEQLEHEKKYHDTLDNLLEGFQIIDFNWRYTYVNNAVVKQSKFSREELLGRTMMEVYPGIEDSELFKTMSLCMEARVYHEFENTFAWPDGSTGCFHLSIQPTEGGLTILSNDISDRKRSEKEKKEYTSALERVLFMTSHNLRQPITQVHGLGNILEIFVKGNPELEKVVAHLKVPAFALDDYTRDLTGVLQAMEIKAKK